MTKEEVQLKVNHSLDDLYQIDKFLFKNNLCEQCINHRFAVHLDKQNFGDGYFVDCEYNQSYSNGPKRVSNKNGNYIDIVVTKRNKNWQDDFICFETKRWNNRSNSSKVKDRENLKILTAGKRFGYKFGFYVMFGLERSEVEIETYENGYKLNSN